MVAPLGQHFNTNKRSQVNTMDGDNFWLTPTITQAPTSPLFLSPGSPDGPQRRCCWNARATLAAAVAAAAAPSELDGKPAALDPRPLTLTGTLFPPSPADVTPPCGCCRGSGGVGSCASTRDSTSESLALELFAFVVAVERSSCQGKVELTGGLGK